MKLHIILLSVFIFVMNTAFPLTASAQEEVREVNARALFQIEENTPEAEDSTALIPAIPSGDIDSLLSIWYIQKSPINTAEFFLIEEEDILPADMPDSMYIRRLASIVSPVTLPYNNIIRNFIVAYTQRHAKHMENILGLGEYYLPLFEEILDLYGLPLELKILPIIESALNPVAVSRVGATGMWQFMLRTGREYGLTKTSFVDERCDPVASAHAAAHYLKDMYRIFGDWTLVLASYNCGAGNVNKAIKRAGGKRDYWEIYPYLPKETRNYVPLFVAASYAVHYHKEHKLTPKVINFPKSIDTFMINQMLHFDQITEVVGIPMEILQDLNPQYTRNIIPGKEKPYELRIPFEFTNIYIDKEDEMYAYKDSIYFNPQRIANPALTGAAKQSVKGKERNTHAVKKGETLSLIAQKYKVRLSDLQEWNHLTSKSKIRIGQKLVVYKAATAKKTETNTAKSTPATTNAEKSTTASTPETKDNTTTTAAKANTTTAKNNQAPKVHVVKKGENLGLISKKYGVGVQSLLKINGLTSQSKLHVGQKIKLR